MKHDDWDEDEEDWTDDEEDLDDHESTSCPECGETIHSFLDKCPACGYWLSESDRRRAWGDASPARWIRATAIVVLVVLLAPFVLFLLRLW